MFSDYLRAMYFTDGPLFVYKKIGLCVIVETDQGAPCSWARFIGPFLERNHAVEYMEQVLHGVKTEDGKGWRMPNNNVYVIESLNHPATYKDVENRG
jgi:hypothetical protein